MLLSTLTAVDMLKMQFMTWMVSITRGLSFLITLEVVMTVVIVIMIMVVAVPT